MNTENQAAVGAQVERGIVQHTPQWTPADEAMRWLNEVELTQGGANGPTIKLRAALLALSKPVSATIDSVDEPGDWAPRAA